MLIGTSNIVIFSVVVVGNELYGPSTHHMLIRFEHLFLHSHKYLCQQRVKNNSKDTVRKGYSKKQFFLCHMLYPFDSALKIVYS